jgi:DNA-directed RNA polymerase specialized sigma24 family protein
MLMHRLSEVSAGPDDPAVLVRTCGGSMLAVARRILGSDRGAQEVVHGVFRQLFMSPEVAPRGGTLTGWLREVTLRAAAERVRSRSDSREPIPSRLLPRFDEAGECEQPPRPWAMPGEVLGARSAGRKMFRDSVDRLPAVHRAAYVLCDVEGIDMTEAADLLGLDPAALRRRLHQARLALGAIVGEALAS